MISIKKINSKFPAIFINIILLCDLAITVNMKVHIGSSNERKIMSKVVILLLFFAMYPAEVKMVK